jgi:hypothetical protein
MTLAHGQTILIKRRPEPKPLPATVLPLERVAQASPNGSAPRQEMLFGEEPGGQAETNIAKANVFDAALERVIASGFDERVVGHEILSLADESVAQASQLASAVTAVYRTSAARRPRSASD